MEKKKEKISFKYIGPFILKYKWHFFMGLLTLVLVDYFQLKIPAITAEVTDGLNTGSITKEGLKDYMLQLAGIGLVMGIGRFVWRYFIFGTSRKIEYHLRKQYFEHLEKMSLSFYNTHKTGDLMAYAINDLNAIRMMVGPGLLMAFDASVLTIMVVFNMVTNISVQMTVLALLPLPLIAVFTLILGKQMRARFKEKQEAFAKLTELVQENISGIRVVKAFVQESREIVAFNKKNQNNFDKNINVVKIVALLFPIITVVSGLSIAVVLGVGGYFAMIGKLSLGNFVALIQYLMLLVWPMIAVGWCINVVSQGLASLKRYQEVLDIEPDVFDEDTIVDVNKLEGNITINNFDYIYDQGVHALKNVNMEIKAGETVGIVGRTGSGKTTLMNLLVRMYNPERNKIFIDGIDIMNIPLKVLRGAIGYVPQDSFLFSTNIYDNIGFDEAYTNDEIMEAAKKANVHDNIVEFTEGYETIIGERGVTLSGGQKQRISIARALIKTSSIMILDDSLSAVDTKTEEGILEHLREERDKRTTLIISHRISSIQDADRIFVFDDGEIVESGNHEELLLGKGLYYEIAQKQQLEQAIQEEE